MPDDARARLEPGVPRDPDAAIHALIRNEIKVEKRVEPGFRVVRFATGRRHGLGWFLPRYLRAVGPRWPSELLELWCNDGRCLVDGQIVGSAWQVVPGRQVELKIPVTPPDPATVSPLAVLWHDRHLLFANKPTGQLAHQAGKQIAGTLLNQLQDWAAEHDIDRNEVRLLNRIDRETSGIVIASLDLAAHQALAVQLEARTLRKEYRAICCGLPEPRDGDWSEPLGPLGEHTIRRGVLPEGQPSRTEYHVEEIAGGYAALRLVLHTGRQHQIRVHAAHHGHPLLGDWVYGAPIAELPGQALHAWMVELNHPLSNECLRVEAPFPPVLAALWERLRSGGTATPMELTADQRSKLG
ncbi:MAG: RluA family pseudouridine synthase [Planctomycetota bacterium]